MKTKTHICHAECLENRMVGKMLCCFVDQNPTLSRRSGVFRVPDEIRFSLDAL